MPRTTAASSGADLVRERLIAALLVGCVVILLGVASGLGISTTSSAGSPTTQTVTVTESPNPAPLPTTQMSTPTAYVMAPVGLPGTPTDPVTSAATPSPQPSTPGSSTSAPAPPSQPSMPTPRPVTPPTCSTTLFDSVLMLLSKVLRGPNLLSGLISSVTSAVGLIDVGRIFALTPAQRTAQIRALFDGPLRVQAASTADLAAACTARLNLLAMILRTP